MGNWTLVSKSVAGLSDQTRGNETVWIFQFERPDTGERALVMAENEEQTWKKLTVGDYEKG